MSYIKMKHMFHAEYTSPVSLTVFWIIKENGANMPELLSYAYVS
jgi:hypothetical protein